MTDISVPRKADAGQIDYGSDRLVDDGEWHHICGVYDNGTATIYIDGEPESPVTQGTTMGSGTLRYGYIGKNSEATAENQAGPGGNPLSGDLDDLRIYDNAGKTSEATLTLVYPRDWTEEGVTKLSLWVRGSTANAADRIYVALNGTAVVYHDDPAATQISGWNEWVIDLATFGIDLTNVNSITIGIGTQNVAAPDGGMGTVYFDDIRLIR